MGMTEGLSSDEVEMLARLEQRVQVGLTGLRGAADALREIRDRRLYRGSHSSFDSYCRDRWGSHRSTIYRHIDAFNVREKLSPIGDKLLLETLPESALRPLASLSAPDCVRVMTSVLDGLTPGQRPTAEKIKVAVRSLQQAKSAVTVSESSVSRSFETVADSRSMDISADDDSRTETCTENHHTETLQTTLPDEYIGKHAVLRQLNLFAEHEEPSVIVGLYDMLGDIARKHLPEPTHDVRSIVIAAESLGEKGMQEVIGLLYEALGREEPIEAPEEPIEVPEEKTKVAGIPVAAPKTPQEAVEACERVRELLPKGKREFDALMHKKWYGRAELSSKVKPSVYLPRLPGNGENLVCLIHEMRYRRNELLAMDRSVWRHVEHKKLAIDLIEGTHRMVEELRRHIDPESAQPMLEFLPECLDTPEFNAAWKERKEIMRRRGANLPANWADEVLAKFEKVGVVKAVESLREANMKNHWKLKYVDYEPQEFGSRYGSKKDDGSNGFGKDMTPEIMKLVKGGIESIPSSARKSESFMRARSVERQRLGLPDDRVSPVGA